VIEKLQAHYGFTRMPFGRNLAPGMLHRHASHNEAVARISWCISERSIGVVTGEVGAGKTVSVRTVLSSLDPSRHTVIYLPNPLIGVRGIHEEIVNAFGQPAAHLGSRLTVQAGKALAAEREERGRTPVLVLDEAHLLTYEQLETIRMLTNQSMDQDSPLACLLVGQPTLRRTMKLAVLAALEQRTALRYTMPGMTSAETNSYIAHHLKLAGRADQLFTEDALNLSTPPPAAIPARSTTSPFNPWSPRSPPARTSSTTTPPAPQSPKSSTNTGHLANNHRHLTDENPPRQHTAGFRVPHHRHPQRRATHGHISGGIPTERDRDRQIQHNLARIMHRQRQPPRSQPAPQLLGQATAPGGLHQQHPTGVRHQRLATGDH
jgi:type II secretory pathway predicted ATPase ExeA